MPGSSPWKLPPGPERRARLRLLDVTITAEDYTEGELAALRMERSDPVGRDQRVAAMDAGDKAVV
jgi:hypothetical protein